VCVESGSGAVSMSASSYARVGISAESLSRHQYRLARSLPPRTAARRVGTLGRRICERVARSGGAAGDRSAPSGIGARRLRCRSRSSRTCSSRREYTSPCADAYRTSSSRRANGYDGKDARRSSSRECGDGAGHGRRAATLCDPRCPADHGGAGSRVRVRRALTAYRELTMRSVPDGYRLDAAPRTPTSHGTGPAPRPGAAAAMSGQP